MQRLILTISFIFSLIASFGQSHLRWATKQVIFRSGPGTEYEKISSIFQGSQIFIISIELENNDRHIFSPHDRKTIASVAGKCSYRASAPFVIPNVGIELWESNMLYSWEFYIVTERKKLCI